MAPKKKNQLRGVRKIKKAKRTIKNGYEISKKAAVDAPSNFMLDMIKKLPTNIVKAARRIKNMLVLSSVFIVSMFIKIIGVTTITAIKSSME